MNLDIDGTIRRITQECLKEENTVCKGTCMSTLIYQVIYVSVTLIDKADYKDPTKREDDWIYTLKTKATLGLNAEDGL